MDFFKHQDKARLNTKILVVFFILSVALTVLSICTIIGIIYPELYVLDQKRYVLSTFETYSSPWFDYFIMNLNWNPILSFAGILTTTMLAVSFFKLIQLREGGGKAVVRIFGARQILSNCDSLKEKKLLNIIEEMSLASGLSVPNVYVLDDELSINAFAAGNSPADAVIAVSSGLLNNLDRDETQAVIAHEVGHIVQGDMAMNMKLIGILHGLLAFTQMGRIILRSSPRSRGKSGNPVALLGAVLFFVGLIGYFFASLIKAGISRQREFLADASAVQFTRNPSAMTSTLLKVSQFGSKIFSPYSSQISHMFFAAGLSGFLSNLFSTHPSIKDRIKRISPNFKFASPIPDNYSNFSEMPSAETQFFAPNEPSASDRTSSTSKDDKFITKQTLVQSVGSPSTTGIALAQEFMNNLDDQIKVLLADAHSARALIFCLLISKEQNNKRRQFEILRQRCDESTFNLTARSIDKIHSFMQTSSRLPLLDLCFSSLKTMSRNQTEEFLNSVDTLIVTDNKVELFEFVVSYLLKINLSSKYSRLKNTRMLTTPEAGAVILSALSQYGHRDDEEQMQKAYISGAAWLQISSQYASAPVSWDFDTFESALRKLNLLTFKNKKIFLDACLKVIRNDNQVNQDEADLVRVISDALSCPMPAFH